MTTDLSAHILRQLRRFMFCLAAIIFAITPVELWFSNHVQSPTQLIPFVLCLLGVLGVLLVVWQPYAKQILIVRASMILTIVASAYGTFEHVENNIEFAREINPAIAGVDLLTKALGGANPLLAPGILAIAAIIVLLALHKFSASPPFVK